MWAYEMWLKISQIKFTNSFLLHNVYRPCLAHYTFWLFSGLTSNAVRVSVAESSSTYILSKSLKCWFLFHHPQHIGPIIIAKCSRWKIFPSKHLPTGSLVMAVNCLIAPCGPKPFPHSTRWGSYAAKPSYFHVSSKNSYPPWSCQIYSSLQEKVTHKATTRHGWNSCLIVFL